MYKLVQTLIYGWSWVLICVIIIIYHTIPFIWAVTLTHVNWYHSSMIYLSWKNSHCQRFMPNLCYIIYIDLFIRALWFTDNFQ